MADVAILGAGSWGCALAFVLSENGHTVTVWSHRKEQAELYSRTHINEKLPGVKLPEEISFTSDLDEAVRQKDLLVMAVPSTATRQTAEKIKNLIPSRQRIVVVSKGIEENTRMTQTGILEDVLPEAEVGVLSGPSHAEEVVRALPTAVVAGAKKRAFALFLQEIFMNPVFRVYISSDLTGIEIGASLKNVIALAAGMSDGLGYGDNAKAALITRGVREITSLAKACGGREETVGGLTGVGDLIVTCSSVHSRNRRAGMLIGQGRTPKEAMEEVAMVVEGVYSAKSAKALADIHHLSLPITNAVNEVLFEDLPAKEAVFRLMNRGKKSELPGEIWE